MNSPQPVLQVSDLTTRFNTEAGTVHAVNGVSFDLAAGEVVGIVGIRADLRGPGVPVCVVIAGEAQAKLL